MCGRNYCMEKRDKRKQLLKILLGICIFSFIGISVIRLIDFKQKIVEDSIEFHQNACRKAQRIAKQNESDIIDCIKNDDKENKIKKITVQYKKASPGVYDSMSCVDVPCYVNGDKSLNCDVLLKEDDNTVDEFGYEMNSIPNDKLLKYLGYDSF